MSKTHQVCDLCSFFMLYDGKFNVKVEFPNFDDPFTGLFKQEFILGIKFNASFVLQMTMVSFACIRLMQSS